MSTQRTYDQPLPRRVLIAGTSGVGKTTLARELAARLGLPYVEIDGLFHGPDWTPRPEFLADVAALAAQERWVTEWQYRAARPLLLERADTLVWLDYPRALVMWRVIKRTVRRRLLREELWNGNVEPPLWHSFTHPEGIVRWAWTTHARTAERMRDLELRGTHVVVVRLRSPGEAASWLSRVVPT